jgi:hypothetical protein
MHPALAFYGLILVGFFWFSIFACSVKKESPKHEARCAKLLRRCREDGLTRLECEVHLKQWQCYVSEEK